MSGRRGAGDIAAPLVFHETDSGREPRGYLAFERGLLSAANGQGSTKCSMEGGTSTPARQRAALPPSLEEGKNAATDVCPIMPRSLA